MARFIEVKPVNPAVTDQEFINLDHVKAIYHDPGSGAWALWTFDDRTLVPADPGKLEAILDGK